MSAIYVKGKKMERLKSQKSPIRRAKIEALQAQMSRKEGDIVCHILNCIVRGSYFDADEMKENTHVPWNSPSSSSGTTNSEMRGDGFDEHVIGKPENEMGGKPPPIPT